MKNRYAALQKIQQERVNALPIKFAFSDKQFETHNALVLLKIDHSRFVKIGRDALLSY